MDMADLITDQRIADFSKRVGQDIKSDRVRITGNEINISKLNETVGIHNKRLDNLTAAAQGKNFTFQTDADAAYSKLVPAGAMPYAGVKSYGGRTLVWNQLFYTTNKTGTFNSVAATSFSDLWIHAHEDKHPPIIGHTYLALCFMKTSGFSDSTMSSVSIAFNASSLTTVSTNINKTNIISYLKSNKREKIYWLGVMGGKKHYEKQDYWYIRCWDTENFVGTVEYDSYMFDLTLMFGAGNEPATVEEFEAMFPADYYEYNAGELLSAGVSEVISTGNLLPYVADMTPKTVNGVTITPLGDGKYHINGNRNEGTNNFYIRFKLEKPINFSGIKRFYYKLRNNKLAPSISIGFDGSFSYLASPINRICSVTYDGDSVIDTIAFYIAQNVSNLTVQPSIELRADATPYTPYKETTVTIPPAVQNLPGYGWSAGTAKNWVDWEKKIYHREVSAYTVTGNEEINTYNGNTFRLYGQFEHTAPNWNIVGNVITRKCVSDTEYNLRFNDITDNRIALATVSNRYLFMFNLAGSQDVKYFKEFITGETIYYELATPELIDISDLLPADNLIEVEAGGTLTFKNQHGDDYCIPIPSEVEYMINVEEAL